MKNLVKFKKNTVSVLMMKEKNMVGKKNMASVLKKKNKTLRIFYRPDKNGIQSTSLGEDR